MAPTDTNVCNAQKDSWEKKARQPRQATAQYSMDIRPMSPLPQSQQEPNTVNITPSSSLTCLNRITYEDEEATNQISNTQSLPSSSQEPQPETHQISNTQSLPSSSQESQPENSSQPLGLSSTSRQDVAQEVLPESCQGTPQQANDLPQSGKNIGTVDSTVLGMFRDHNLNILQKIESTLIPLGKMNGREELTADADAKKRFLSMFVPECFWLVTEDANFESTPKYEIVENVWTDWYYPLVSFDWNIVSVFEDKLKLKKIRVITNFRALSTPLDPDADILAAYGQIQDQIDIGSGLIENRNFNITKVRSKQYFQRVKRELSTDTTKAKDIYRKFSAFVHSTKIIVNLRLIQRFGILLVAISAVFGSLANLRQDILAFSWIGVVSATIALVMILFDFVVKMVESYYIRQVIKKHVPVQQEEDQDDSDETV